MITAEQLVGEELANWYSLTPMERWRESAKLWQEFLSMGGSLDPEPDTQSPFFDPATPSPRPVDVLPAAKARWRAKRLEESVNKRRKRGR